VKQNQFCTERANAKSILHGKSKRKINFARKEQTQNNMHSKSKRKINLERKEQTQNNNALQKQNNNALQDRNAALA